jgi:hypothetical protein
VDGRVIGQVYMRDLLAALNKEGAQHERH